jgi:hypothetical protein
MSAELPPTLKESIENSKAEYRYLGQSGLRVSVPILGAMSFGDVRTLDCTYPGGINLFSCP